MRRVAELEIGPVVAAGERVEVDRGDDLARLETVVAPRLVAGEAMVIGERDEPLAIRPVIGGARISGRRSEFRGRMAADPESITCGPSAPRATSAVMIASPISAFTLPDGSPKSTLLQGDCFMGYMTSIRMHWWLSHQGVLSRPRC